MALERFLTVVRSTMLDKALENDSYQLADTASHAATGLNFYCALARQCFINEGVFAYTDEEWEKAQVLKNRLVAAMDAGSSIPALWLAAAGAYFSLSSLPSVASLLDVEWPDSVAALLTQQVREPLEERTYRTGIPCLTVIEDDVSRIVQQQYEENPYPRWVQAPPTGKALSVNAYLRQKFPSSSWQPLDNAAQVDILVAGCGTGQQPIQTARQFRSAQVLAVDLSVTSLSYARRKTQELGLTNIAYAQADIMQLGSLDRQFDIVESVGVLHHLADPMAGWRVLVSLVRPGRFMKLGFYSELARQNVVAARHFAVERGYGGNAQDIRQCRQELMSGEYADRFKNALSFRDFYGMSECRDLLFHVQEHRYTLPRITDCLAELGLDFVGFTLESHVLQQYRECFPQDVSMTALDCWHVFEKDYPDTFAGMYQFWVQKRNGKTAMTFYGKKPLIERLYSPAK